MSRVIFDDQPSTPQFNLGRADVACFVGLVRLLPGSSVPSGMAAWLIALGFSAAQIQQITNVPILLETYAAFGSIFDTGGSAASFGTDYTTAAVRSFFAQGGRRCYVVRVADPVTPDDDLPGSSSDRRTIKQAKLASVLPNTTYAPDDRQSWTGVGCLATLQDVSFLAVPDLPALCASQPEGAAGQIPDVSSGPEEFVECSQGDITPPEYRTYPSSAPRLAAADYTVWAASVASIVNYLAGGPNRNEPHLREVQFVTAFPLPSRTWTPQTAAENPSSAELAQDVHDVIQAQMSQPSSYGLPIGTGKSLQRFPSARLSLAQDQRIGNSSRIAGVTGWRLVGLFLARNTLTRGTFTSATKVAPSEDLTTCIPRFPRQIPQVLRHQTGAADLIFSGLHLIDRLSLLDCRRTAWRLLSDVTALRRRALPSRAPVNAPGVQVDMPGRAQRSGETTIVPAEYSRLVGRIQHALQNLMTRLWSLNALDGARLRMPSPYAAIKAP